MFKFYSKTRVDNASKHQYVIEQYPWHKSISVLIAPIRNSSEGASLQKRNDNYTHRSSNGTELLSSKLTVEKYTNNFFEFQPY